MSPSCFRFFFNAPAPTEIYTLSLHDALPICPGDHAGVVVGGGVLHRDPPRPRRDRKSTRLNSSHRCISYAVFCLKKKKHGNSETERPKDTKNQSNVDHAPTQADNNPTINCLE